MKIRDERGLNFDDVYIIPQYSEVASRSQVDVSMISGEGSDSFAIGVPVISANMDSITEDHMAIAMWKSEALGALHRFMPIAKNVELYKNVKEHEADCFVSIGVNGDSRERAQELHRAGATMFIVDIAHGHSKAMNDMCTWLKKTFPGVWVVGGNVATPEAYMSLKYVEVDAVKVGIGPGSVCLTKNVTGVTVPQFTAIVNVAAKKQEMIDKGFKAPLVIADGGITEIGDIAKALGAGADMVMSGRMFAGCSEVPYLGAHGEAIYRGMASKGAMLSIKDADALPTPEGAETKVFNQGSAIDVVKHIKGGLQSAFSYVGATNLEEFQVKCEFGTRYNK